MADISRMASPMSICEEDLFDVSKKVDQKKKRLTELQNKPPSFFVGSIDRVNERISNLDSELSVYDSKLAFENTSSASEEVCHLDSTRKKSVVRRLTRSAKVREEKETKKFEGAFSQDSSFVRDVKVNRRKVYTKKSDEPRLVELQQFPGFDPTSLTPLPHQLQATTVIDHVVEAQVDLKRKPAYKQDFSKMMYAKSQRAILQDCFWWFFLDKFHPNKHEQSNLFKRIAQKFVALMLMPCDKEFKHLFFVNYANVLAQSVYSAFCIAFPQSWRQFDNEEFKEMLMRTSTIWVAGICPQPRLFETWNYSALEPEAMRKDEIMKVSTPPDQKKKAKSPSIRISPSMSATSTKTTTGRKSFSQRGNARLSRSDAPSSVSSNKTKINESATERNLTPIIERTDENASPAPQQPGTSKKAYVSCAAGRTIEFDRCVFNLHGGSPLLNQYLHERGLDRTTGNDNLVRRTQIGTYPSYDAQTYHDIINSSISDVKKTVTEFTKLHTENEKLSNDFDTKMTEDRRLFEKKTNKLLARAKPVKNLSNLILMEMKKDQDEVNSVGAAAALQSALSAETVS